MQTGNTKRVIKVEVEFLEEEWGLLEGGTDIGYPPTQYIHDATMGKLKRAKAKTTKKGNDNENQ